MGNLEGLITVGLFRGNRTAWGCALVPSVLSIFGALSLIVGGPKPIDYLVIALVAADLYLLLHPATRAWLRPTREYRDSVGGWLNK